jgi:lysophospholipase L1-like esterase
MISKEISKKLFKVFLLGCWICVCFEIIIRVISNFIPIYNLEMIKFSRTMTKRVDQFISHEHKPNAKAHVMGVELKFNSLGHRSQELQVNKKQNEKRIYFLGSSVTLGWGVPEEDGFVALVEKKLNSKRNKELEVNYIAINGGVLNYNTVYQVELFKKQFEYVDPDIVVLTYFLNDSETNPQIEKNVLIRNSLFAGFLSYYIRAIFLSSQASIQDKYILSHQNGNPGWEAAKSSIRELKKICDDKGIPLVAFLLPDLQNLSEDSKYPDLYNKIKSTFNDIDIEMINPFKDIQAKFKNDPSKAWVAHDDSHPNSEAHMILARNLFEYFAGRNKNS